MFKFLVLTAIIFCLKVSLEIELPKTSKIHSTFSPNQIDDPINLHFNTQPKGIIKVKVENKSGEVVGVSTVLMVMRGQSRQTLLFTKNGILNSFEIVSVLNSYIQNAKSFKDGEYQGTIYVQDNELGNLEYPFGKILIKSGNEVEEDDFAPKPELEHTFRKDVEEVNPLIPNVFVGLTVILPWIILLGMVSDFWFVLLSHLIYLRIPLTI